MALSKSRTDGPPAFAVYARGVKTALALGGLAALLKVAGVRRATSIVFGLARRLPADRSRAPLTLVQIRGMAKQIAAVADRTPLKPQCLPRSLLLAALLERHGVTTDLCLGAVAGGAFGAHAWVEVAGEPVNDTADVASRFHTFLRLDADSR